MKLQRCVALLGLVSLSACSDCGVASAGTDAAQRRDVAKGEDASVIDVNVAADASGHDVALADVVESADVALADAEPSNESPNILLVIADDLGVDASNQYHFANDLPPTPTFDALADEGIVFENAWATPACTTTRATMISGLYGVHSGVTFVPAVMDSQTQILQALLENGDQSGAYRSAIFGKWHLGGGNPPSDHPNAFGLDHYAGNLSGNLGNYSAWTMTTNGVEEEQNEYHTSRITDVAIDWINSDDDPWFAWVAYAAPHSPFHLPPANLHTQNLSGEQTDIDANRRAYYLAMVESLDTEIGRMLNALTPEVRANTLVIFIGDNGTPRPVLDRPTFANHGKGTLYEGGIRVPLIVSGAGTRAGVREEALVNSVDIFESVAELLGNNSITTQDSESFASLLSDENAPTRRYNYAEFESDNVSGWTVRNARHKLIVFEDGSEELYDLDESIAETNNLIADASLTSIAEELRDEGLRIRGESVGNAIDITGVTFSDRNASCAHYVNDYSSQATDVARSQLFEGALSISLSGDKCVFQTNAIPNHDFNDGGRAFPNVVSAQNKSYEVTQTPSFAAQNTELLLTVDNGIFRNGVKIDLLAAGCFGVGNGRVGCNDINQPWRYDPMHAPNGFRVDSHNAHTQPDGTYHYHGPPNALFESPDENASGLVGFAADGFPIFGSFIDDGQQTRRVNSSYRLREGARPTGPGDPAGNYDGSFRDDYEYVPGAGDLDECNGALRDGVYGYYITDAFPWVMACFKGTPDASFNKRQ